MNSMENNLVDVEKIKKDQKMLMSIGSAILFAISIFLWLLKSGYFEVPYN